MKFILFLSAISFLVSSCTTAHRMENPSREVASLDNDSDTILDPALESSKDPKKEEEDSKKVAGLIGEFIKGQSDRRALHAQEGKISDSEKRILEDVPQTSQDGRPLPPEVRAHYATRDVHRKNNGCYFAKLEVSSSIQADLNKQIAAFIAERTAQGTSTPAKAGDPVPETISNPIQLGIFQPGAKYDAIVRYSNGHPGDRWDREPDARGMALKILPFGTVAHAVPEMQVDMLNQATLLDILTINFPTFFVNDPITYFKVNQRFLKGAEDFRGFLSAQAYQGAGIGLSGMTHLQVKLALLSNGSVIHSPLFQKYFSMVPSRLGFRGEARAVKYAFFPTACEGKDVEFAAEAKTQMAPWTQDRRYSFLPKPLWAEKKIFPFFKDTRIPPFKSGYPADYLRINGKDRLTKAPFCFSLVFQLYRDQTSTNIEDSTDFWAGDANDAAAWNQMLRSGIELPSNYYKGIDAKKYSPYIKVATVRIAQVDRNYPSENTKTCEDLSFSPWNGKIGAHKPLGVVSRMKRRVYNASRRTRHTINGLPTQDWEREKKGEKPD